MRALATVAACVAAVRISGQERERTHTRSRSGPPSPEEIFEHCDANKDKLLEMKEAIDCGTRFVTQQIKEHWPRDDAGKPVAVTLKQLKKNLQGH